MAVSEEQFRSLLKRVHDLEEALREMQARFGPLTQAVPTQTAAEQDQGLSDIYAKINDIFENIRAQLRNVNPLDNEQRNALERMVTLTGNFRQAFEDGNEGLEIYIRQELQDLFVGEHESRSRCTIIGIIKYLLDRQMRPLEAEVRIDFSQALIKQGDSYESAILCTRFVFGEDCRIYFTWGTGRLFMWTMFYVMVSISKLLAGVR